MSIRIRTFSIASALAISAISHAQNPQVNYNDSDYINKQITSTTRSNQFHDQVILITGGTSGIGLATASAFAKANAGHIIITGRHPKKWQQSYVQLSKSLSKKELNKIEYVQSDVRLESDVKRLINTIYDKYGRLDVAFNNAGVQPGDVTTNSFIENTHFESSRDKNGSIAYHLPSSPSSSKTQWKTNDPTRSTPISDFRESEIATSIFGSYYSMKWEIAAAFSKQPKNLPMSIINTSSRNGIIPDPKRTLYASSKAFIIAMTRSLANQVAQRAVKDNRAMVRINVIAPGPVDTPLEHGAYPGNKKTFNKGASVGVPMQRVASPDEITPAVLFLADYKQSSYITGAILPIDGGDVASPLMTKGKAS